MKNDPSNFVRFDPTLMITGNQMDPGDENDFARRQCQNADIMRQNALSRFKLLSATQYIKHNEVPELGPEIRAA